MAARRSHPNKVKNHHLFIIALGIVVFLILIVYLTSYILARKQLTLAGSVPTCLSLDASIQKKNKTNYLYFNAKVSVPLPKNDNIECRVRYYYNNNTRVSQFGNVSFTTPVDLDNQLCDGRFPLKNEVGKNKITVVLSVDNTSKNINGGKCQTTLSLP